MVKIDVYIKCHLQVGVPGPGFRWFSVRPVTVMSSGIGLGWLGVLRNGP